MKVLSMPLFGSVFLLTTLSMPAHAALDLDFVPNEVQVSDPTMGLRGIIDPEIDSLGNQFCWADRYGKVFLGKIDPNTGDFTPTNGRSELIDTEAVTTGEIGNGPEWVFTSNGPQIAYTKYVNDIPVLARAFKVNGRWEKLNLQMGYLRTGPIGSLDRGDETPMISYQGPKNGQSFSPLFVRPLTDGSLEQQVTSTDEFRTPGGRWIEGQNAIVFTRPMPDGESPPRQIFKYDFDTQELKQLTFDRGNKIAAFMWRAPEYNDELTMMALIGETKLRIYRYMYDEEQGIYAWTNVQVIDPPSTGDYIWSPEPFVYDGKSYITMVTSTSDDQQTLTIPSEVWMSDIDPEDTLYRKLSNEIEVNRKDPEVYISPVLGPLVYAAVAAGVDGPDINRLYTGIPLAQPPGC